jgi:small-conductance mechanosensitive channel
MTDEITRKDLKIQALLEKVSQLTTQYENQVADLRVDLTLVSSERDQLHAKVADFETDTVKEDPEAEVVKIEEPDVPKKPTPRKK